MIRAILWDCDGVLVTTVNLHAKAFAEAVNRVSGSILTAEVQYQLNGLSTREKLTRLVDLGAVCREHVEEVWTLKQRLTVARIPECIRPDPVKVGMVSALARRYRQACVSNSIRLTTDAMLRAADLYDGMELILSNEDVERQKPSPAPYLAAMDRLGLPPEECMAVEDAPHGRRSARQSGCHVMEVDSYKDVTLLNVVSFIHTVET